MACGICASTPPLAPTCAPRCAGGASDDELAEIVASTWRGRADRGAEDRLMARDRGVFVPATTLKRNPHLEMHTRGG